MKTWIFKALFLLGLYLLLNALALALAAPLFAVVWNYAAPTLFHLPGCDVKTAFCFLAAAWLLRQLSEGIGFDLEDRLGRGA